MEYEFVAWNKNICVSFKVLFYGSQSSINMCATFLDFQLFGPQNNLNPTIILSSSIMHIPSKAYGHAIHEGGAGGT